MPAKPAPAPAKGAPAKGAKGKDAKPPPKKQIVVEIPAEPDAPPMRVFLVIAHPEPNRRSLLHAIYRKTIETLKLNKHEVMTCDLYESGFATLPSLNDFDEIHSELSYGEHQRRSLYKEDILRQQTRVEWCTHLVLFTPLFWLSPSAALMAWWEKVFGEGWAWTTGQTEKLNMAGKKAMVVVSCGQDQRFYGKGAINVTIEELMYPLTFRCFYRCGFTPLRSQAIFGVATAQPQDRIDMINGWAEHVMTLETRDAIEFVTSDETSHVMESDKVTNHKLLAGLGDTILIKPKDPYAFAFD
jgi:NAD(P)H dehydrogenase (quinone)